MKAALAPHATRHTNPVRLPNESEDPTMTAAMDVFTRRPLVAGAPRLRRPAAGIALLALAAALVIPHVAAAMAPLAAVKQRGIDPASTYATGEVDNINPFNGNLALTIPLGQAYTFPSGLSYSFSLSYNSGAWDSLVISGSAAEHPGTSVMVSMASPMGDGNAGLGWKISLGDLYPPQAQLNAQRIANEDLPVNESGHWIFVGADGARHAFYPRLHPDRTDGVHEDVGYTSDGTYLRMRPVRRALGRIFERAVDRPDGTSYYFTFDCGTRPMHGRVPNPDADDCWRLTRIEDAFVRPNPADPEHTHSHLDIADSGHYVEISYPSGATGTITVRDSLGRVHRIHSAPETGHLNAVQSVDLAAPSADLDLPEADRRAIYTLDTVPVELARPCTAGVYTAISILGVSITPTLPVPLLKTLTLPDQSKYSFQYLETTQPTSSNEGNCHVQPGRLLAMQDPRGQHVEWEYTALSYGTSDCRTYSDENGLPGPTPTATAWAAIGKRRAWPDAAKRSEELELTRFRYEEPIEFMPADVRFQYSICEHVYRQLITSVQTPDGDVVTHYFNLWREDELWSGNNAPDYASTIPGIEFGSDLEFGFPGTRFQWSDGLTLVPAPLGGSRPRRLFLSTENYDCPAGHDIDAHPYPPEGYVDVESYLLRPAAVRGCAKLRQTFVAHDYDAATPAVPAPDPFNTCLTPDSAYPDIFYLGCGDLNRRLRETKTVFNDDGNRFVSTRMSDFDGLGNFRTTIVDGNVSRGASDQAARTTEIDYGGSDGEATAVTGLGTICSNLACTGNTGAHQSLRAIPTPQAPWLLGLARSQEITQANQTVREEFCRDPDNGFLTRTRQYVEFGRSARRHDVITRFLPALASDGKAARGEIAQVRIHGGHDHQLDVGDAEGPDDCAGTDLDDETPAYVQTLAYTHGQVSRVAYVSPTQPTEELWVSSSAVVDRNSGLALRATDASGLSTTTGYDVMGRVIRTDATGLPSTDTGYCVASRPGCEGRNEISSVSRAGGVTVSDKRWLMDGFGRVHTELAVAAASFSGTRLLQRESRYRHGGQLEQQSIWHECPAGQAVPCAPSNKTSSYAYDALGRLTSLQSPDGSMVWTEYVGAGKVTRKRNVQTGAGVLTARQEQLFDEFGRLVEVHEQAQGTDADPGFTNTYYGYDVNGKLDYARTDGQDAAGDCIGQERFFMHDALGRPVLLKVPEFGRSGGVSCGTLASGDIIGRTEHVQYDALGNVLKSVYGAGARTIHNRYDALGRLVQTFDGNPDAGGRILVEAFYGSSNPGPTDIRQGKLMMARRHTYVPLDPRDLEAGERHWVVRENYRYENAAGLLTHSSTRTAQLSGPVHRAGGLGFDTRISYLPSGEVDRISYPECLEGVCSDTGLPARIVDHRYLYGDTSSVGLILGGQRRLLADMSYLPSGLIGTVRHYNAAGSVVARDQRVADRDGVPRPFKVFFEQKSGSDFVEYWSSGEIGYDGSGDIIRMGGDRFTYDRAGRLRTATIGGRLQEGRYDSFGNLLTLSAGTDASGVPVVRVLPVDSATNRFGGPGYGHDAFGNLTTWQGRRVAYDALDMPVAMAWEESGELVSRAFVYAPGNERLVAIEHGQGAVEDWTLRGPSGDAMRELQRAPGGAAIWQRDYVSLGGDTSMSFEAADGGERLRYYHVDHLGSTRAITDEQGGVVARYDFYPFGEFAAVSGAEADDKRRLFTGHERDRGAGGSTDDIDYMIGRYYAPAYGRFLSIDPADARTDAPQSWNRYAYVLNNPLINTDPTGFECVSAAVGGSPGQAAQCAQYQDREPQLRQAPPPTPLQRGINFLYEHKLISGRQYDGLSKVADVFKMTAQGTMFSTAAIGAGVPSPVIAPRGPASVPRSGPRGVDPDHHNANVMVRNADGRVVSHQRVVSGNMTPDEKALGFPRNTLASHTEARAVRDTPLSSGQSMTITGQRPPCPSCRGAMNRAAREGGANIQYQWRQDGATRRWQTPRQQ